MQGLKGVEKAFEAELLVELKVLKRVEASVVLEVLKGNEERETLKAIKASEMLNSLKPVQRQMRSVSSSSTCWHEINYACVTETEPLLFRDLTKH